jgi:DNA damage-binding protein 1
MGNRIEFMEKIHENVLILSLDTHGDKLLVGDLMQSMSVFSMTQKDPLSLKMLGIDSKPTWMTAVKFVNENIYIGSDDRNNVFTLSLNTIIRQSHQKNHNENINSRSAKKLELEGGYHIGSLINCFRQGILLDVLSSSSNSSNQQHNENDQIVLGSAIEPPFTFATIHGSIGTIKTISEESFKYFWNIQQEILKYKNNIGNLDHQLWRSYKPKIHSNNQQQQQQQQTSATCNYLDGDLLKSFQYMSKLEKQIIVDLIPPSRQTIKDIEEQINTLIS